VPEALVGFSHSHLSAAWRNAMLSKSEGRIVEKSPAIHTLLAGSRSCFMPININATIKALPLVDLIVNLWMENQRLFLIVQGIKADWRQQPI
jgi:hypothetical protein